MTDQARALPGGLAGYAARAEALLPPATAAYFLRGAGREETCRANLSDLEQIRIWPRALAPLAGGNTQRTLLGQRLDVPMLIAPMAYLPVLDAEGEAGVAAAATAQGVGMCLSAQAGQPMETVREAGTACQWMQLYWQAGRAPTMALAERAARAGFAALVLTVDAPVNGIRDAEIASGFTLPAGIRAVNLDGLPRPQFAPLKDGESVLFDRVAHVLPDWEDVTWFCANAPLPVLLKGILHPGDAAQAVTAGAAGVIVSNHGGRVLDGAPSAISALPGVVAQVCGAVPVLMDGGIRRGADVFRALALGASAVLIGRPVCHGLAVAGALGVSHVLRLFRDELEVTMALAGCRTPEDISSACVQPPTLSGSCSSEG
jgi:4-hydroxymandelate oxidase